jgi:hypothetical protein
MLQFFRASFYDSTSVSDYNVSNFMMLLNMNCKAFAMKQSGLNEALSTYFPGGPEGNQERLLPPPTPPIQNLGRNSAQISNQ